MYGLRTGIDDITDGLLLEKSFWVMSLETGCGGSMNVEGSGQCYSRDSISAVDIDQLPAWLTTLTTPDQVSTV